MSASPWAHRTPPIREPESATVGRWRPATPAELTLARRQLDVALHDGARPAATDEDAVQRLLLAFEELASNALRHGRLPVEVAVTRTGCSWLLEVSDAAADRAPSPAVDRDPALGGLGLPLVATICAAQGWTVQGHRKLVWARVDYTHAAAPAPLSDPGPRGTSGGHHPAN
jgi:anti-sigma regulatory factor (Ser/Thr protein kinase)